MDGVSDFDQARAIGEALHRHYPGHLWAVHVSAETGIATIRNLRLSGRWGFVIRLRDLNADPSMRRVVMAGGELLERWHLARGPYDEAQAAGRAVNAYGELLGDTTGGG